MPAKEVIIKQVRGLLEQERRINVHRHPIKVGVTDGAVVLEGDVEDIAAKKLALELASSVSGVSSVVDRLRMMPSERKGDGTIRDLLCGFVLTQAELRNCGLRVRTNGRVETLRDAPADAAGEIEIGVADGVITLQGTVISLSHKRIAGVLAWWTPGCRDVVNALAIVPGEEDNDDEVADALRLVLEMDPLVQADSIAAKADNYIVTLEGQVRTDVERRRAEFDAWALFAVDRVVNNLEVR